MTFFNLLLSCWFALAADPNLEANKKTVSAFYDLAFNQHQPAEAMKKYVGETYKQHNPFSGDGKQPFVDFFSGYFKQNPQVRVEIKRLIAEGDLVVVHVLSKQNPADRGNAVVDIFRVTNGKISEHWDVVQAIPEKLAHSNTMF